MAKIINQYLARMFNLGPYRRQNEQEMRETVDFINENVQLRPDLFAQITEVYGPDVGSLAISLQNKRDEYLYHSMYNYVSSTIFCSRDDDRRIYENMKENAMKIVLPNGYNGPVMRQIEDMLIGIALFGERVGLE